jgi:hypothetical protein
MRSNGRASQRDERDSKRGIVEVATRQTFDTVRLGRTLASELAKMIPEPTCFALKSPRVILVNKDSVGNLTFIPFIPVNASIQLDPCFLIF